MIRILITKFVFILTYTINAQTTIPLSVHSNTSHVLYVNCSNSIAITLLPCTSTFSAKSVAFIAINATVTIDSTLNNTFYLTIIPDGSFPKVVLNAIEGSSLLATETFILKKLPAPQIHIFTQGKEIDLKNGLYGLPKNISIVPILDEDVQDIIPFEPQYMVTDFEILFIKNGKYLAKIQKKSYSIDLRIIKNIESTENIIITINEIKLVMPDGQLKNIPFGNTILTIPIIK